MRPHTPLVLLLGLALLSLTILPRASTPQMTDAAHASFGVDTTDETIVHDDALDASTAPPEPAAPLADLFDAPPPATEAPIARPSCLLPPRVGGPQLSFTQVAEGLDRPVQLVPSRDGTGRLLIALQGGAVLQLCNGMILPQPFLDLRDVVIEEEEAGLLGLTLSPDATEAFAFYVSLDRAIEIWRYPIAEPTGLASAEAGERMLRIPAGPGSHFGGTLAFGPDGMLYISVGDTDEQDNPTRSARDLASLQGKILRIDTSLRPYAIPDDNPFVDGGGRPEIWAWGLRNPWRMSIDPLTGDLWIADVGGSHAEEINLLRAGEKAVDFGWPVWEGHIHRIPEEEVPGARAPEHTYRPTRGFCAITGGFVYRGGALPQLEGRFVFSDFCHRNILVMGLDDDGAWTVTPLAPITPTTVGVALDEAGTVYALQRMGTLLRLEPEADAQAA